MSFKTKSTKNFQRWLILYKYHQNELRHHLRPLFLSKSFLFLFFRFLHIQSLLILILIISSINSISVLCTYSLFHNLSIYLSISLCVGVCVGVCVCMCVCVSLAWFRPFWIREKSQFSFFFIPSQCPSLPGNADYIALDMSVFVATSLNSWPIDGFSGKQFSQANGRWRCLKL